MANTLEIKIWTPNDPKPSTVVGGHVNSMYDNDGSWVLSSSDNITHIKDFANKGDITKIEVVQGTTLTSLEDTFSGLVNLTHFVWYGSCHVTNFKNAWSGDVKLTGFSEMDFSHGTDFTTTWKNCSSLKRFNKLNFTNLLKGASAFYGCTDLIQPPKNGTSVRSDNDAVAGSETFESISNVKTVKYALSYIAEVPTKEKPFDLPGKLGYTFDGGLGVKWVHDGTEWVEWRTEGKRGPRGTTAILEDRGTFDVMEATIASLAKAGDIEVESLVDAESHLKQLYNYTEHTLVDYKRDVEYAKRIALQEIANATEEALKLIHDAKQ